MFGIATLQVSANSNLCNLKNYPNCEAADHCKWDSGADATTGDAIAYCKDFTPQDYCDTKSS